MTKSFPAPFIFVKRSTAVCYHNLIAKPTQPKERLLETAEPKRRRLKIAAPWLPQEDSRSICVASF
jgi:hypothetical protein